tara:strand:+ start:337 stop:489 length:153 start_codon:yes stop_codon:yes gene_type:complete
MTAPTYTKIRITDKNSAFRTNHKTAEKKNEKTKLIADFTALLEMMTFTDE